MKSPVHLKRKLRKSENGKAQQNTNHRVNGILIVRGSALLTDVYSSAWRCSVYIKACSTNEVNVYIKPSTSKTHTQKVPLV